LAGTGLRGPVFFSVSGGRPTWPSDSLAQNPIGVAPWCGWRVRKKCMGAQLCDAVPAQDML